MSNDSQWEDGGDDIVIKPQLGIAVYCNGSGEIIIRQQSSIHDEDDPFVFFPREKAKAIVAAIRRAVTEGK